MQRPLAFAPTLALASLCVMLSACGREAAVAPPAQADAALASQPAELVAAPLADAGYKADPAGAPVMTAAWQPGAVEAQGGGAMPAAGGLQRVPVMDPNGFEKPLPALWVQVPAGWKSAGGVVWNQQAPCGATPSYQWQAQSPDGRQSLQMFPAEAWSFNNLGMNVPTGNCPSWPITNVRDYLQSFVQRHRPGARVLDFRTRADLIRSAPPPSDGQTRFWKEGGEVLLSYNGPNGEVRESVMAVVQFMETTMAGVMPGEVRKFMSGIAGSPVVASAPSGQLDLAMVSHFATSAQPDPQWQARMDRHNTQLAQQGLRGQAARGAIIADTSAQIGAINDAGYAASNASSDAIQRSTIDGINNVDRYTDPTTGQEVQLDNRYDHAWRAGDGTYFQSNDPNLNPQVDLGVDAEQMERSE